MWKDAGYGVEKLDLAGIVTVSVYYAMVTKGEQSGYEFSYSGFKSKRRYASMDEAKAAAIKAVAARLEKAVNAVSLLSPPLQD